MFASPHATDNPVVIDLSAVFCFSLLTGRPVSDRAGNPLWVSSDGSTWYAAPNQLVYRPLGTQTPQFQQLQGASTPDQVLSESVSALWLNANSSRGWAISYDKVYVKIDTSWLRDDQASEQNYTKEPWAHSSLLHSIWMTAREDDGWAVGEDSTILRYRPRSVASLRLTPTGSASLERLEGRWTLQYPAPPIATADCKTIELALFDPTQPDATQPLSCQDYTIKGSVLTFNGTAADKAQRLAHQELQLQARVRYPHPSIPVEVTYLSEPLLMIGPSRPRQLAQLAIGVLALNLLLLAGATRLRILREAVLNPLSANLFGLVITKYLVTDQAIRHIRPLKLSLFRDYRDHLLKSSPAVTTWAEPPAANSHGNDHEDPHPEQSPAAATSKLARKLRGYDNHYGLTGNFKALKQFRRRLERIWREWLNRRSQRKGMTRKPRPGAHSGGPTKTYVPPLIDLMDRPLTAGQHDEPAWRRVFKQLLLEPRRRLWMVQGKSGLGKSALLEKWLALALELGQTPFLIPLRAATGPAHQVSTLMDQFGDLRVRDELALDLLDGGGFVILLDALNEDTSPDLTREFVRRVSKRNLVVLTSQFSSGWEKDLEICFVRLQPFGRPQLEELLDAKWVDPVLASPPLADAVRLPVIAHLLATYLRRHETLPKDRLAIYDGLTLDLDAARLLSLEEAAWKLFQTNDTLFPADGRLPKEFCDQAVTAGLLSFVPPLNYRFSHETIHGYMVARYLDRQDPRPLLDWHRSTEGGRPRAIWTEVLDFWAETRACRAIDHPEARASYLNFLREVAAFDRLIFASRLYTQYDRLRNSGSLPPDPEFIAWTATFLAATAETGSRG